MNCECFKFEDNVKICISSSVNREYVNKIWHNFTFTESNAKILQCDDMHITVGECDAPTLPEGAEYAVKVTKTGASVAAKDRSSLMRGYFDLVMKIQADKASERGFIISVGEWRDSFTVKKRMIHFCIFKETGYAYIRKMLRFAACLGYTHAVIEFWGTYKYECMPGLSWPGAFTKDEIKALVDEARELGIEPVPMINHLGHAASARENSGKHAVLDRSPRLHRFFMPDGWSWDITSPAVYELLRKMRAELYSVFGDGEYFHAGLDEAYMFSKSEENCALMIRHLEKMTDEIVKEGRRPLVWCDMLLPRESGSKHHCACKDEATADKILKALNKKTVLVDWDYDVTKAPVPTATYHSGKGFEIIGAPWYLKDNIKAYTETAKMGYIDGVMVTTWHTLARFTHSVLLAAREMGAPKAPWSDVSTFKHETATLLRKLNFEGFTSYEECGFAESEISLGVGEMF